jgi:hypothetical protein
VHQHRLNKQPSVLHSEAAAAMTRVPTRKPHRVRLRRRYGPVLHLDRSVGDQNIGTGSVYPNDCEAHWKPSTGQYQWLKAELEAHPDALKSRSGTTPYADSSSQPSDTYLQGAGTGRQQRRHCLLTGMLTGYERNARDSAGRVSYVFGNGGAALGRVSRCSSFDLYAIGSSGAHCGAPAGLTDDYVYGFAKVTVDGYRQM